MYGQEEALWQITGLQDDPVELPAHDWLSALGQALRAKGRMDALGGLACEQLSEGVVIVHDLEHRARYVLQRQGAPAALALSDEAPIPLQDAPDAPTSPDGAFAAFAINDPAPPPLIHDPVYDVEVYDVSSFDLDSLDDALPSDLPDHDDPSDEVTVMIHRAELT